MGEIVDLERYRKQRNRREAAAKAAKTAKEAKTAKLGDRRDGARSKGTTSPPAADRAESSHAGRNGAAKLGDDPNPD